MPMFGHALAQVPNVGDMLVLGLRSAALACRISAMDVTGRSRVVKGSVRPVVRRVPRHCPGNWQRATTAKLAGTMSRARLLKFDENAVELSAR